MTRVRLDSRGLRGQRRTGARAATAPRLRSGHALAASLPRLLFLAASALGSALPATSPTFAELSSGPIPNTQETEAPARTLTTVKTAAGRQIEVRVEERLLGVCAAVAAANAGDTGGRRRLVLLTAPHGDPAAARTL